MISAFAIVTIEHLFVMRMNRAAESDRKRQIWLCSGLTKTFAVVVVLAIISFVRHTPSISAEYETVSVPPKDAPNVILIVLDAVRQDRMSVYGHTRETTPRIVELAREG